jgi:hypothetical protein
MMRRIGALYPLLDQGGLSVITSLRNPCAKTKKNPVIFEKSGIQPKH